MVIYAQRTAFRSSAQFPDFTVTSLITDGQILRYDDTLRAFINVDASTISGGGSAGTVTDGINLGTGSQVLSGINLSDELEFRTLLGGQGISLVQGTNEISVTNTIISTASISVTDSFDIVIDNDDNTVNSAVLSLSTVDNPASVSFIPVTYTRTDITVVLPNQFVTTAGDFIAAGLQTGMSLKVTGTTEQDGIWEISLVTTDTITITVPFPNPFDAALQPSTAFEGILFGFPTGNTLQLVGRDVAVDGFLATQSLTIAGSTSNDGTYIITTAAGDTITVSGSGATATSSRTADVVTGTVITAAGSGYIAPPIVTFADPTAGTTATGTSILGALTATVVARGSGYVVADILTLVGGTGTEAAIFDVNNLSTVAGQDETYFDNAPTTEGTFVAGIGYAVSDTITLSDGSIITVDAATAGIISGFTITSASTSGIVGDAQTLTQSSTSGNGTGFTLTLDTDNQGVFDVTVTATDGAYTVLPTDPVSTTTGGTGTGLTLDVIDWGVVGITITNGGTGYTVDPAITISVWSTGNDVGNIVVSVPAITVPTGWQVDETGNMTANDTTITGALASTTLTVGGSDINTIISGALPSFPADGILVRTAADTYTAVSIAVDATLTVANANGLTGNPTLGIIDDVVLPGNGAVTIPSGNNGGRPGTPVNGMIRYHTTNDEVESYIDGQWVTFFTGVATDFLAITGGTLTGNLALGANNITTVGTVDGRDVAADGVILDAINTGTGIKIQTAADTFVNRTITGTAPIVVTNGDGVAGNPLVVFDISSVTALEVGQVVDEVNDDVLIYDASQTALRSVSPQRLFAAKMAQRYFMAQI